MSGEMVIGDDGFIEIVGEQTRGGQQVMGAVYEVLGELMDKSPALKQYVEKRIGAQRPVVQRQAYTKAQDWQLDFGPVYGTAGGNTTITVNPQCLFRGEKAMATDPGTTAGIGTADPAGYGSRVGQILVGNQLQRPASTKTLTAFFAPNALGNGIKWATCQKGLSIAITVDFIKNCTFEMTVYGKAVL